MADKTTPQAIAELTSETEEEGRAAIEQFHAPEFIRADLTDLVMNFGGAVWTRPGLDMSLRSLATISTLAALGRLEPLREHIGRGLDNGLNPRQVCETLIQVGFYAGMPAAVEALDVAHDVFNARGIKDDGSA